MASVLHVALQVVDDVKTLLTPFLPSSSSQGARAARRRRGRGPAMPELVEVDEPTAAGLAVLLGAHRRLRHRRPVGVDADRRSGGRSPPPTPVFTKLDPSVVDEELARLAERAASDAGRDRAANSRQCRGQCEPPRPTAGGAGLRRAHPPGRDGRSGPASPRTTPFVADGDGRGARGRRRSARSPSATRSRSSRWCVGGGRRAPGRLSRRSPCTRPRSAGLTDADYAELEALARDSRVVAVGETGLDYYWDRTEPAEQQEHFRRHIELAKRVGKPLMIHDREAHADVLRILREEGAPEQVVFHAFSGDAEMAARVRARPATSCPSPACSPSATRRRCGPRRPWCRWNSCWSRPTRRS